MNKKTKLTTKLSTKAIMSVAKVVCNVWWYGRCKLRRQVNDFDYHIEDLREQYPNELVYKSAMGKIPFFNKVIEVDDEYEKTSSIKIGDCNITYTFDKLAKVSEASDYIPQLFNFRLSMIKDKITQTMVRHNQPQSLKVINTTKKGSNNNVVKLYNK